MPMECACTADDNNELIETCSFHVRWRQLSNDRVREIEREACAKIADDMYTVSKSSTLYIEDVEEHMSDRIAAAIRARSNINS